MKQVPEKQFTKEQLTWAHDLPLTEKQLEILLAPTPKKYRQMKPGRGNSGDLEYVSIGYILNVLNLLFGWDWDFQILDQQYDLEIRQCFVRGRLTVRTAGKTIIKEQFGSREVLFTKAGKPVDLGNSLKGAASDCIKKCASELGVARDVYHKDEFTAVTIKKTRQSKHDALQRYLAAAESLEDVQEVSNQYELEYGMDDTANEMITKAENNYLND